MNSVLNSRGYIKQLIAVWLLAVFILGITPKIALHYLIAKHADSTSALKDSKSEQLSKAGYNCKCDDLVAESYFIAVTPGINFGIAVFSIVFTSFYGSLVSLPPGLYNLRGPPLNF